MSKDAQAGVSKTTSPFCAIFEAAKTILFMSSAPSKKNIKAIIGIGKEWPKIRSKINKKSKILFVEGAENMNKIVLAASKIAKEGDVVLLTPACASFDMFKNYKDRGEQFKKEVNLL